ncbi:MAG TPA: hypothetical protein VGM24_09695, partial [Puia sp.]
SLLFPGEMLKNKNPHFTPDSAFYPVSAYDLLFFSNKQEISGETSVPANIYYCQSGFFCKREWELEKATHIPFRFRLGSLDYCNALEGKH